MIYCPNYTADYPLFTPHSERKPIGIAGTMSDGAYPMRTRMQRILSDLDPVPQRKELREKFIEVLGDYRIGLTDDVRFGSVVAKYFEIPMAGSLLIAPEPHTEIEKLILGFNDENSALIPRNKIYDDNYVEKLVRDCVADIKGTEIRAKRGQELSRRRHTVEARVRYIWMIFQRMRAGIWSIREQFDLFLASEVGKSSIENYNITDNVKYDENKVLISLHDDWKIQDILSCIGPNTSKVTIIGKTITDAERACSQIAYKNGTASIEYLLSDRTAFERAALDHDICLTVGTSGVNKPEISRELNYWVNEPVNTEIRQKGLNFFKNVEIALKNRFGNDVIKLTIDENFDWIYGGIDFWLWHSRAHCSRIRIQGIYSDKLTIGTYVSDGLGDNLKEKMLSIICDDFDEHGSNDHWHTYSIRDKIDYSKDNLDLEVQKIAKICGDALVLSMNFVTSTSNYFDRM